MTVIELINVLLSMPQDSMVVLPGYEGGYKEVSLVDVVKLLLNVNTESYYGPHEVSSTSGNVPAVLLC